MKDAELNRFLDEGGDLQFDFSRSTVNEYKKQGYRKMLGNEAAAASAAFNHIPREIAHQIYDANVRKAFDDAVQGSLIAVLKPGTYMPMSKTTPGALSNVGLSIETNKAGVGNPVFFKNNAVLNTPAGPRIVMGILNAVSFAVGQYNMVQITGSLKMLQTGVEGIMDFLKDEQKAKLKTAIQIYDRVCREMKYAMGNEQRLSDLRSQIYMTVMPTAMELMNFSVTHMDKLMKKLKTDDSNETIQRNLKDINDVFLQYKVATLLYEKATQLLYYLSQTGDVDEIKDLYLTPLEESSKQYAANCDRWFKKTRGYLRSCKAPNGRSGIRNVASVGTGIFVTLLSSSPISGVRIFELVDALFADDQKEKKTTQQKQANSLFQEMLEFETIEAPYQAVQKSMRVLEDGIKIVKIGDDYYTNFPALNS